MTNRQGGPLLGVRQSQARVVAVAFRDPEGTTDSRLAPKASYFFTEARLAPSVFNLSANEICFTRKDDNKKLLTTPKIRTTLNGLRLPASDLRVMRTIEEDMRFPQDSKDKLLRSVIMSNIVPLGFLTGQDGAVAPQNAGTRDITQKSIAIDVGGTANFKVQVGDLALGVETEVAPPLEHEWKNDPTFYDDPDTYGRLTLYMRECVRQPLDDKLFEMLAEFNLYNNMENYDIVHDLMKDVHLANAVPPQLRLVYWFTRLVKIIQLLTLQKAISSGIGRMRNASVESHNAYPSFTEDFYAPGAPGENYQEGLGAKTRVFSEPTHKKHVGPNHEYIFATPIELPGSSNGKFNILSGLYDHQENRVVGSTTDRDMRFKDSMQFLTTAMILSESTSATVSHCSYPHVRAIHPDGHLGLKHAWFNLCKHNYMRLIYNALPRRIADYYRLGTLMVNGLPVVNEQMVRQTVFSELQDADPSSSTSYAHSSQPIPDHYNYCKNRDFTRTSNFMTEVLGSFLEMAARYSEEINNGARMIVISPATHGQSATVYTRG